MVFLMSFWVTKKRTTFVYYLLIKNIRSMDVISTAKIREKAANWINSKIKDISTGIKILESANYKPNVMKNFREHMLRRDIPDKLMREMRNYLRYYVTKESEIHNDIVVFPEVLELVKSVGQDSANEYPENVKQIIKELSEVYNLRGKFHKQLSTTGEGNTAKQKKDRQKILLIVKACSDRIKVLSESFEKFKEDGTIPSPEILKNVFDVEKVSLKSPVEEKSEAEFVLAENLEDLKKQKEGWRIKITRAENKLLYQSDKRLDKTNPMPAGPKKIKQEKRIAKLKKEKNQIDLAIANWE